MLVVQKLQARLISDIMMVAALPLCANTSQSLPDS